VLLRLLGSLGLRVGASLSRGGGVLRVLGLGSGSGSRVLRLGGRRSGLVSVDGVLRLDRRLRLDGRSRLGGVLRLDRRSRLVRVDGVDGLDGVLRLRDNDNWGLADGLGSRSRDGVRRSRDGLALAVRALLVGVAVVLALIEVPAVLINIADELASVVDGVVLVTLTLVAVADNALVALLILVVGVVALSALADLELVPGIVVALLGSAEAIVADNLPLGAGRAVNLRSTVVTVADDDDVGWDDGDDLGDSGSGSDTVLGLGDSGSGGDRRKGLSDEVGVDDSVSLTRVDADGNINGEKDVDRDLSTHESIASEATTVLSIVARAGDVTLVGANGIGVGEIEAATTVASVVVKTEVAGAQASLGTLLRVVLLVGVSLSEAGEAVLGREAAEEVEAIRVSDATSSGGGLSSSTSGSSASLGTGGSAGLGASLDSTGGAVGEGHGVELSRGHVAHGQGDDLCVTHFVVGWFL
jgi:hypothetical protein